jgi:arylsulfatase A-like enzyme
MLRIQLTRSEHGWYDKRFIYEESFQMPFLACGAGIPKGAICKDIVSNVDFAPTWLEYAGIPIPSNMQGESFLDSMLDRRSEPQGPDAVAYHRYWMNEDENNNVYVSE